MALKNLKVSLDAVRYDVERIVGRGTQIPSGHIPFTPRAKKLLELGLREALQLGHNYVGTEHILLGLIREGEGVGAQVLVNHGVSLTNVRQEVIRILGGAHTTVASPAPSNPGITLEDAKTIVRFFDAFDQVFGVVPGFGGLDISPAIGRLRDAIAEES